MKLKNIKNIDLVIVNFYPFEETILKTKNVDKIIENIKACIGAILKAKPSSVKGVYFKKFSISSTMSPGLKIDKSEFTN